MGQYNQQHEQYDECRDIIHVDFELLHFVSPSFMPAAEPVAYLMMSSSVTPRILLRSNTAGDLSFMHHIETVADTHTFGQLR